MSDTLEKEIINAFVKAITEDTSIPIELSKLISSLHAEDKISKASHLKKVIEEFIPFSEGGASEIPKN